MSTKLRIVALAMLLSLSGPASAGGVDPMLQPERVVLDARVAPGADARRMHDAIVEAGRAHTWRVQSDKPGELMLHLLVRNKHDVVVRVQYDAAGYQIFYFSSDNLDYRIKRGRPVIHSSYNRWITILMRDIDKHYGY